MCVEGKYQAGVRRVGRNEATQQQTNEQRRNERKKERQADNEQTDRKAHSQSDCRHKLELVAGRNVSKNLNFHFLNFRYVSTHSMKILPPFWLQWLQQQGSSILKWVWGVEVEPASDSSATTGTDSEDRKQNQSQDMGIWGSKEAHEQSHLVNEFIADELKYVAALDTVENLFITPLKNRSNQAKLGIDNGNTFIYRVFANWSSIRELHHDLASKLLKTCTSGQSENLDPSQKLNLRPHAQHLLPVVFLDFVPFFKLYSEFLKVQGGHLSTADPTIKKRKVRTNKRQWS